jgi:ribosomal protein S18 acetylase RimI-like enzyme
MDRIHFRDARVEDAAELAALFRETFTETFGHLYRADDLAAFLGEHTPEHWAEQLRDPQFAVRIAERDGMAVGLAKLGPVKLPVDDKANALELRQLYVAAEVRGSGIAAELMEWLVREARERGAAALYLSVYTDNERAQRFYRRYGFVSVGPCVFMVGSQPDEDVIMRRDLS